MYVVGTVARVGKETCVLAVGERGHKFLHGARVFLLKHLGELALPAVALVVDAVAVNMVDEEERQHLDALGEELALVLQVGLDGFAYLVAAHDVVVGSPHHVALVQRQSVEQMHGARQSVDAFNDVVVPVLVQSAALGQQVVAVAHHFHRLAHAVGGLLVETDACHGIALRYDDLVEVDVAVGGGAAQLVNAAHLNLLHQFAVVGVDGVEAEHHVADVVLAVGGAI